MSVNLLPQAFWFRLAVPCHRVEGMPRNNGKGSLLGLPESSLLPDLSPLEADRHSWAAIKVGWNAKGLGISVHATGTMAPRSADSPFGSIADVQLWIDTRDTRNVNRATRFCHRFMARLVPRRGKELGVEVTQRPIARAIADPPMTRPEVFLTTATTERDGWSLDWFIPAEALHGFDPETNRRLGFAYQISNHVQDDQYLAVGREFPVGENPSLWSTLELIG